MCEKMNESYLRLNNVKVVVQTWGLCVEDCHSSVAKDIVICIPGNPGVTRFYSTFLRTIHEKTGYPVWIIGHTGHEVPNNFHKSLQGNESLYGLQSQINHKKAFIEKYVPEDAKVHFVGHSIGAYVILQLLKVPSIQLRAVNNYLLFPAIENLSDSPNGKFLNGIVKHITWIILFFSWIFSILPLKLQSLLIHMYLMFYNIPKSHLETLVNFIHPRILEKVFFMAFEEMNMVKNRDNDVISENKNKIKLYYGAKDGWVPTAYCDKLKHDISDIDAQICSKNFEHAFVLKNSIEVGAMVSDWLIE